MRAIKIGIIGDYDGTRPSHRATEDALYHSALFLSLDIAALFQPQLSSTAAQPHKLLNQFLLKAAE